MTFTIKDFVVIIREPNIQQQCYIYTDSDVKSQRNSNMIMKPVLY